MDEKSFAYRMVVPCFYYKGKTYNEGAKFVYNGKCNYTHPGCLTKLNNAIVVFSHQQANQAVFTYNDNIYSVDLHEFTNGIVKTVEEKKIKPQNQVQQQEQMKLYWTDEKVNKTIWYIIIMLFAIIFNDCIIIWIIATICWIVSINSNE